MDNENEIEVNGIKYVRKDMAPRGNNRHVLVVDRGWIFAGDLTEKDSRIYLDRAVHVFRWERIGFEAVIENPKQAGVDIRPCPTRVDIPSDAEVFRQPVADDWGL